MAARSRIVRVCTCDGNPTDSLELHNLSSFTQFVANGQLSSHVRARAEDSLFQLWRRRQILETILEFVQA